MSQRRKPNPLPAGNSRFARAKSSRPRRSHSSRWKTITCGVEKKRNNEDSQDELAGKRAGCSKPRRISSSRWKTITYGVERRNNGDSQDKHARVKTKRIGERVGSVRVLRSQFPTSLNDPKHTIYQSVLSIIRVYSCRPRINPVPPSVICLGQIQSQACGGFELTINFKRVRRPFRRRPRPVHRDPRHGASKGVGQTLRQGN